MYLVRFVGHKICDICNQHEMILGCMTGKVTQHFILRNSALKLQ